MDKLFSTLCTAGNIVAQPVSLFAQNPYYYFCKARALNKMIAVAYNKNNIRCIGTLINQKIS